MIEHHAECGLDLDHGGDCCAVLSLVERDALVLKLDTAEKDAFAFSAEISRLEGELGYFRQRSLTQLRSGWYCKICNSSWANSRGEPLHEQWCPHTPGSYDAIVGPK